MVEKSLLYFRTLGGFITLAMMRRIKSSNEIMVIKISMIIWLQLFINKIQTRLDSSVILSLSLRGDWVFLEVF